MNHRYRAARGQFRYEIRRLTVKSRSREIGSLNHRIVFNRCIGSIALWTPIEYQNYRTIVKTNRATIRFFILSPLNKMATISKMTFSNEFSWMKHFVFDSNFTDVSSKDPTDKKSALVQVMAWRRIGDKPLPEPMPIQRNDLYTAQWGVYYKASYWLKWYLGNLM